MKAIILACSPTECEKIANGDMSILVRKKVPKETPFKVYIYCAKSDKYLLDRDSDGSMFCWDKKEHHYPFKYEKDHEELFNGKVIGSFICNEVEELHEWELSPQGKFADFEKERLENFLTAACLSEEEVVRYRENLPYYKPLYGWHISDLKIYGKPKELSEFKTGCKGCKERDTYHCKFYCYGERPLTRPPKNYIYVEEQENSNE